MGGTLLEELEEVVNPNEIVTDAPAEQFRLGYLDVICLVLNRVIGEFAALARRDFWSVVSLTGSSKGRGSLTARIES